MKKFNRTFKTLLKKFKTLFNINDNELLKKYLVSKLRLNIAIKKDKSLEKITANRGQIYSVDFGYRDGSELRDRHYCVVLAAIGNVANVIPLTSKIPKDKRIPYVDLGIISKLSNKKKSYALINQITTVSKAKLIKPRVNNKIQYVKLNAYELNNIENEIRKLFFKSPNNTFII